MKFPTGVKPLNVTKWTNKHESFTVHLTKGASFDVSVSDPEFKKKNPTFWNKYNATTKNLQWIVNYALEHKIRLRAMGSGWSLSKVMVADDGIINTKKLRLTARLGKNLVSKDYIDKGGDPSNLVFAQTGNSIVAVTNLLEKQRRPRKSLRASGGSKGQTIYGALCTGTHGAALKYGPVAKMVAGLHIVTGPDSHVWLEPKSKQVTSDEFRKKIGAKVIIDDDLFHSAVISFGCYGIIHGLILEVEPIYLLEKEQFRVPYNKALVDAITKGDFTKLASKMKYSIEDINKTLYHFELAVNPHDFKKNDPNKGAYLRVMYKLPYREDYPRIDRTSEGKTYGDDLLGVMSKLLDALDKLPGQIAEKALIPKLVNGLFKSGYNETDGSIGTIGEMFDNNSFRGQIYSTAFSFDRKRIPEVLDIVLNLNKKIPFGGGVAMRFVKGYPAPLNWVHFPNTCVLELDGVDSALNRKFTERFLLEVEEQGIKYAMHWGKINKLLNPKRVKKIYGQHLVKWQENRKKLLKKDVREVFTNEFMERCGLDDDGGMIFL